MAPYEAPPPPARRATPTHRHAPPSMFAIAAAAAAAKRSASPPRPRPPNTRHRSTNQYAFEDDDDDLELPVVSSKPLSSADSIAKFHRVRIVGVSDDVDVHTRRPHGHNGSEAKPPATRKRSGSTSSTASSASTVSARSSIASSVSSSPSSSSGSGPNPFTAKSRARAHQRPKYHGAASAKQIVRHNRLSSLVLHSVTPRDGVSSSSSSAGSASSSASYVEYVVVVENVRTSQLWQVARRFSSFVQFRKELSALFATPHCHHCTAMHAKLDALHDEFPAKRLWGSRAKSVTAQRARKLQAYLHGLLALAAKSHTKQCRLVSASFAMHLRGFLTVESTGFHGIPGGDLGGHSIPSMLQELSLANTGAAVAAPRKRAPLATILENVPSQSVRAAPWADHDSLALLEKDEDAETEDEDDASPSSSSDNQRDI